MFFCYYNKIIFTTKHKIKNTYRMNQSIVQIKETASTEDNFPLHGNMEP